MLVDFNAGSVSLGVTGKNGDTSPEARIDQIQMSVSDNQDLYEVIRGMFPEYRYSKIKTSPVNHVYFDQDGSVRALFQVCYESSRINMHEWRKMVYHGLSLIMVISLQSFDKYIRVKKESIVDTVKKYVNQNYAHNITLSEICAKYFYSVPYVSHKFKKDCGCSFEQYLRQVRIQHACELLLKTGRSVDEIGESCGYTSVRSFRKAFREVTENTPIEFKNKYLP
jgi:AraC-like DNA-binding protein